MILIICMLPHADEAIGKSTTVEDLLVKINKKSHGMNKDKTNFIPKAKKLKFKSRDVDLSKIKPPKSSSLLNKKSTEQERELLRVTDEGINQLYTLTRRFKKSSKRGELWLRLAELYSEKARLIEYQIQNEFDEKIKLYNSKKLKKRPRLNLKPAQIYNKKGIQLYEWFIRDFPKDKKMDQALFYLGYNYFEMLDEEKGTKYYFRLSKEYPKSKYVSESNFALGEFYFENERWKEALTYYSKVAKNRRARLYSFSLYKVAWCQYKMGKVSSALKSIERVIRVGRKAKGRGDASFRGLSRIRLAEEAIKDLVVFYGEVNKAAGAEEYFRRVSGTRSLGKMLERLGYYYLDTGETNEAKKLFNRLIEKDKYSAKAYDYQYQLVSMFGAAGNDKGFREQAYQWINKYGPGSVWAKSNRKNTTLIEKAHALMESTLRNYVLQKHQTAQNSKAKNAREQALQGYSIYFKTFKSTRRLPEMRFFYAELLFEIGKFREAADQYLWVHKNAPESKYSEKSRFNAILSYDKGLPTENEMKKIVGKSLGRIPFDQTIKNFVNVSEKYIQDYPNSKNATAIHYRIGNLHYYYNHFKESKKIFISVIERDPKSKYAKWSSESLLNIFEIQKDYKGLVAMADKLLAIPSIAKSKLSARIKKNRQNSQFIRAKELESGSGAAQSARAFEEISIKNRGTVLGVKAGFNAAINFAKAGEALKAIALYGMVLRSKKSGKDQKRASLRYMAEISSQVGEFKKAAELYEAYSRKYPKDSLSIQFAYNAAVIREGMLFFTAAIKNYEFYLKKSKSPSRHEINYKIGRIWERRNKKGHFDLAIKYYKKFFNSPTQNLELLVETSFRIARIYEWLGNRSKSNFWYLRTESTVKAFSKKRLNIGRSYAAEAKFKLIYQKYKEFRKIRITLKNASKLIQSKIAKKDALSKQLSSVIRYDDGGMIVASLTLLGQAEQHMAASIINAPIPKELKGEDRKKYIQQIEKIANPFSENAIKLYRDAISKGKKLRGYNKWLLVALKELSKLKSDEGGVTTATIYQPKIVGLIQ